MKKTTVYLLLLILSTFLSIKPFVVESNDFTFITQHTDPDTLVIFDIDNTIGRYEGIGNDEWFMYLVHQKMDQGHDLLSAIYLTLPTAYYAHFSFPLVLTDTILPDLIISLINKNINVIGLTSRGLYLAERTNDQLQAIGITFLMENYYKNEFLLPLPHLCGYKHHIIFTSNNNKGDTLLCFLNMLKYHPKKIIFIDDKMQHVRSIEQALESTDIEYIGIRYTGCDHWIENFDPTTAQA